MKKREQIGIVVSNKTNKTVIVIIQTRYQHLKYKKTLVKIKRYMVHDEENKCKFGDLILFEESAPISRNKNWRLKEILQIHQE